MIDEFFNEVLQLPGTVSAATLQSYVTSLQTKHNTTLYHTTEFVSGEEINNPVDDTLYIVGSPRENRVTCLFGRDLGKSALFQYHARRKREKTVINYFFRGKQNDKTGSEHTCSYDDATSVR